MSILKKKEEKKTEQEKVEERREKVLAAGRKFKYPLQWTRYRVVANTLLIAVVIISMLVIGGWLALYRLGMTSELLFNITKVVPLSVAAVDDENVRFSDYLMLYRSSIISFERQTGNQFEGSLDEISAEYKRSALTDAEKSTYALKLAKELDVTVTKEEIDNEFKRHLSVGGTERSEEGFLKIIQDNFGLDKGEYERMLYLSLNRAKVEQKIDTKANEIAEQVESMLTANGGNFREIAEKLGEIINYEETGGLVDSKNIDGGRAIEAMKLEPGAISGRFVSLNGDGYYFVKLIKKTDSQVNFVSIKVPFTEFNKRFDVLLEEGKINEYIEIKLPEEEAAE